MLKKKPAVKEASAAPVSIVVADHGFVYVGRQELGRLEANGVVVEVVILRNAYNIRYWGTTAGIGQLALGGPTEKTKLDPYGVVVIPVRAVVSIIETKAELWKNI